MLGTEDVINQAGKGVWIRSRCWVEKILNKNVRRFLPFRSASGHQIKGRCH